MDRKRRSRGAPTAARIIIGVAIACLALYAVAGKRDELLGARQALNSMNWAWVVAAVGSEILSLVAFASLQGRLLSGGDIRVLPSSLLGITLAGTALQNSLPGGGAWATVYAFRQFRARGADEVLAAWVPIAVAVLLSTALALLSGAGAAMAGGSAASLGLTGVIAVVVVLAVAAFIGVRRRGSAADTVVDLGAWVISHVAKLRRRPSTDARGRSQAAWQRLTAVTPGRRAWSESLALAGTVWITDCGCLALSFLAVHAPVPWRGLLLAYGAAQLAANLPVTPGGLGVVEGSLTVALVAYGGGRVSTAVGVLLYRILSFWLLLPIGWAAWALIASRQRRRVAEAEGLA